MPQKLISIFAILGVLALVAPAWAQPPLVGATLSTPGTSRVLLLPPQADNADVISLGTGVDPQSGKLVEGYAIIHPKKAAGHKPQHNPPGGKGGNGGSACFSYLSKGAKWKTVEPWVMNGANTRGLGSATLFALQDAALAKWEDAADGVVGNSAGVQIFGAGATTSAALAADTSSPDGQNEVYFADISTTGAIAVTIVWGIFSGPPQLRELVEWDQIYDDVNFDWSAEAGGVVGKMDFDNIATHEDGHSAGMGHPDDSCTEETMYRFSDFTETKKRDLNAGDINGINGLY